MTDKRLQNYGKHTSFLGECVPLLVFAAILFQPSVSSLAGLACRHIVSTSAPASSLVLYIE